MIDCAGNTIRGLVRIDLDHPVLDNVQLDDDFDADVVYRYELLTWAGEWHRSGIKLELNAISAAYFCEHNDMQLIAPSMLTWAKAGATYPWLPAVANQVCQ